MLTQVTQKRGLVEEHKKMQQTPRHFIDLGLFPPMLSGSKQVNYDTDDANYKDKFENVQTNEMINNGDVEILLDLPAQVFTDAIQTQTRYNSDSIR